MSGRELDVSGGRLSAHSREKTPLERGINPKSPNRAKILRPGRVAHVRSHSNSGCPMSRGFRDMGTTDEGGWPSL